MSHFSIVSANLLVLHWCWQLAQPFIFRVSWFDARIQKETFSELCVDMVVHNAPASPLSMEEVVDRVWHAHTRM
jgi:hypothetical protein